MPVGRYFIGVGCALLAMLLLADLWLPRPGPTLSSSDGHAAIRIASAHKWPDRVVFDTNTAVASRPSAAPPMLAATEPLPQPVAKAAVEASRATAAAPREAYAQVIPPAASRPSPRQRHRGHAAALRLAANRPVLNRPVLSWRQEWQPPPWRSRQFADWW